MGKNAFGAWPGRSEPVVSEVWKPDDKKKLGKTESNNGLLTVFSFQTGQKMG